MKWIRRMLWIWSCSRLLRRVCPEWHNSNYWDYADSLHETYVIDGDADWSPEDALAEDMTYWD